MSQNVTHPSMFPLSYSIQYLLVFIYFPQHILISDVSIQRILSIFLRIHILKASLCLSAYRHIYMSVRVYRHTRFYSPWCRNYAGIIYCDRCPYGEKTITKWPLFDRLMTPLLRDGVSDGIFDGTHGWNHDEDFYSWNSVFWCIFAGKGGCSDRYMSFRPPAKYNSAVAFYVAVFFKSIDRASLIVPGTWRVTRVDLQIRTSTNQRRR